MNNMKNYIEILLFIILIVCVYNGECKLLADMMNVSLGKLFMLGLVVLILSAFGKTAGVLAALIYIFILHQHRREGFQEGASLKITLPKIEADKKDEEEKEEKEEKEESFTGASLKMKEGVDEEEDNDMLEEENYDNKEGFISLSFSSPFSSSKPNTKREGMRKQISKLQKKVRKLEIIQKYKKKEGFANLRQNRRLKLNHISVLNTTDLDRIIKKDSEIRTLNSTA